MSNEEIIEGNRLIAEFMGLKYENGYVIPLDYSGERIGRDLAEYHWSWDWLMPVVEKIDGMEWNKTQNIRIGISKYDCIVYIVKEFSITGETIANLSREKRIEAVYDAVVEFIKWYNQTPTP